MTKIIRFLDLQISIFISGRRPLLFCLTFLLLLSLTRSLVSAESCCANAHNCGGSCCNGTSCAPPATSCTKCCSSSDGPNGCSTGACTFTGGCNSNSCTENNTTPAPPTYVNISYDGGNTFQPASTNAAFSTIVRGTDIVLQFGSAVSSPPGKNPRFNIRLDAETPSWNGSCSNPAAGDVCKTINTVPNTYSFTASDNTNYAFWVSNVRQNKCDTNWKGSSAYKVYFTVHRPIPLANILGDTLIVKGEPGAYMVTGWDYDWEVNLAEMGIYYRHTKNADGTTASDNGWKPFSANPLTCSGTYCQYGQLVGGTLVNPIEWNTTDLASGYYDIAVNAHSTEPGGNPAKCTGNPDCDYSKAGHGEFACWDWLDCDPDSPPGPENDYLAVRIIECGNGVTEPGEQCDGDVGCATDCTWTYCGDGTKQTPNGENDGSGFDEECDDGNNSNTDSCNVRGENMDGNDRCTLTYCGDGIVQKPNGKGINSGDPGFSEDCDDGDNIDGDGCSFDCLEEGQAWLKTEQGDVFSQGGITFGSEGMPGEMYLSNYLCLKGTGNFDVGGAGCSSFGWEYDDPNDTEWRDTIVNEIDEFFDTVRTAIDSDQLVGVMEVEDDSDSCTIHGLDIDELMLYWTDKDLTISGNVKYADTVTDESTAGLIYLVNRDLTIEPNVSKVAGLYLVKGNVNILGSSDLVQLTVDGGILAKGNIIPGRTLGVNNGTNPAEIFRYDPRYIDIFRSIFGEVGRIQFVESGVY